MKIIIDLKDMPKEAAQDVLSEIEVIGNKFENPELLE